SATTSVLGGANGTTNSPDLTEFTPNGATAGSDGLSSTTLTTFGIIATGDTICGGGSATLTASTYGSVPGGSTIVWYSDPGATVLSTGPSYTTPVLTSDTTF